MRRSYAWKGVCMWIRQYCAGVKLLTTCTSTHRVRVLDLCSSWVSHIPPWAPVAAVSGLGMNAEELRCNPLLSERVVLDLNSGPGVRLPFQTEDFHAVLLQLSMWEALTLYLVAFFVIFVKQILCAALSYWWWFNALPFPCHCSDYLTYPVNVLREAARVLKPDGLLIIRWCLAP